MPTPTTLPELLTELYAQKPKLYAKVDATAFICNKYMIETVSQVSQARDPAAVAVEQDLKSRAIQLVKDLGSNKTDAEIWAILQTLPSKQVNQTAKTFILNGSTTNEKIARHAAWTEIQAVREEAVEGFNKGQHKDFSDPEFGETNETVTQVDRTPWIQVYYGGQEVTPADVLANRP